MEKGRWEVNLELKWEVGIKNGWRRRKRRRRRRRRRMREENNEGGRRRYYDIDVGCLITFIVSAR